jgi:hypothetical protein
VWLLGLGHERQQRKRVVGGGYALANGSNQNMGLDNTFYTGTLAQTAPGYNVIGNCP